MLLIDESMFLCLFKGIGIIFGDSIDPCANNTCLPCGFGGGEFSVSRLTLNEFTDESDVLLPNLFLSAPFISASK